MSRNDQEPAMQPRKPLLIVSLTSCLLLQAACGGGGDAGGPASGGGTGGDTSTTVPRTTVTGIASKGLLLNAIVTFYPVSDGVAGTQPLATVRTSSSTGAFSSPITSAGAVVAVVTVDGSTQMLDELSGVPVAAPAGLILHAAFPGLTNLQPLAVTPLTELAYTLAAGGAGSLSVANIDAANSTVSSVFLNGAPILQTLPIDISNYAGATPAQQAQAKLLTAISVAAKQGIATGTDGAACAIAYPANIPCVIGGLSKLVSVNAGGTATLSAEAGYLSAAYSSINSGTVLLDGGKTPAQLGMDVPTNAETALVESIATQNPLPGYNASADPLINTKDLIANIRSNIINQRTTDTFGFSDKLDALIDDVKINVSPVVSSAGAFLSLAYRSATALRGESPGFECWHHPDATETPANSVVCDYGETDDYVYGQSASSYDSTTTQRWIRLTVTKTGDSSYSVHTRPLERISVYHQTCGGNPYSCQYTDESTPVAAVAGLVELTADFTLAIAAGVQSASVAGPFYVTTTGGRVTANLQAAQSDDWDSNTFSGSVTASGTLSDGAGGISLVQAKIDSDTVLHVRNGKTAADGLFQPEVTHTYTDPDHPENSYSWSEARGLPQTIAGSPPIAVWGAVGIEQLRTASFSYAGKVILDAPSYDVSGTLGIPGNLTLNASIREVLSGGSTAPIFQGAIGTRILGITAFDATQPVSVTNSLTAQTHANGTLSLSSGRVLSVAATLNLDHPFSDPDSESRHSRVKISPDHPASYSVTYRYSTSAGIAELTASGEYDSTDGLAGTITNNAGVIISVQKPVDGSWGGKINAAGVETATFNGDGFVFYRDGTSESLF